MKKLYCILIGSIIIHGCQSNLQGPDAYGNFEATEIMVTSETSGRLIYWNIRDGDMLQAGQPVAIVDTTIIHLKLSELDARLLVIKNSKASAMAEIEVLKEQHKVFTREYDRIKALYNDGAASQQQFDDIEGMVRVQLKQIESAHSKIPILSSEISVIMAQTDIVKEELRRATITSPIDGLVLYTFAEPGELVVAGKPLFRMADLRVMTLRAFLDARQYAGVYQGQKVRIQIDAPIGSAEIYKSYLGTVTWISPRAEFTPRSIQTREDRVTLVYAVKIDVPNDGIIKIGMPGELFLFTNAD